MTRGPARRRAVLRALRLWPLAIACLLALSFLLIPTVARAQTPGVTVVNVRPELRGIDIAIQGGLHHIDVVVSDNNSWGDILRVDMEVLTEARDQVEHAILRAYLGNGSSIWDPTFSENVGQSLVRGQSLATASTSPQTIADRSELRVTFAIQPLIGRWVRITATDLDGLTVTAEVDYVVGTLGGPSLLPPWLLLILAAAAAVVLVGRRIRREIHGG